MVVNLIRPDVARLLAFSLRYFIPAFIGQFDPAKDDQCHWFFYFCAINFRYESEIVKEGCGFS
jgi:hypothetical protein